MTRTGRRRRKVVPQFQCLTRLHRPATCLCCLVRRFFPSCWRRLRVVEEAAGRGLVESRQNVALCNHRRTVVHGMARSFEDAVAWLRDWGVLRPLKVQ